MGGIQSWVPSSFIKERRMRKRRKESEEQKTKNSGNKSTHRGGMKFEGIELAVALEAIAHWNSGKYSDDLNVDIRILREAASKTPPNGCQTFLWLSHPHGTHCFREGDVFLKNSSAYCNWVHYELQMDETTLAYAVEITGCKNGDPIGNLYALDCLEHCKRVMRGALSADRVRLTYERGSRICTVGEFSINDDPQLGKLKRFKMQPNDPEALQRILQREKEIRGHSTSGDFGEYMRSLQKVKRA